MPGMADFIGNMRRVVLLFALLLVPGLRAQDAAPAPVSPPDAAAPAPDTAPVPAEATAPASDAPPPADTGSATAGDTTGNVTFQDFYDSLAKEGTWIQSNDYGYVWQPQVTDPGWAPYTDGHWVYTDAGWTWVSDESFGWATYHYGRWANFDGTGWVWVPGYTWGPAWVSWRYGDGYAGWAPLPPDSFAGIDYGTEGSDLEAGYYIGGDADAFYGIGPGLGTSSCRRTASGSGIITATSARAGDNFGLINRTANVTNLRAVPGTPVDGFGVSRHVTLGGPSLAAVNAANTRPVPAAQSSADERTRGRWPDHTFAARFRAAGRCLPQCATAARYRLDRRGGDQSRPGGHAPARREFTLRRLARDGRTDSPGAPRAGPHSGERQGRDRLRLSAAAGDDACAFEFPDAPLGAAPAPSIYNTSPQAVMPSQRPAFAPSNRVYPQGGLVGLVPRVSGK